MTDCPKCHGTGWWQYDHNHSQPCPECCAHKQGVWPLLPPFYRYSVNDWQWCCVAGCGKSWPGIVDYQKAVRA